MSTWADDVRAAFPDPQLYLRIISAAEQGDRTRLPSIFQDISTYVLSLRGEASASLNPIYAKKRKLENGTEGGVSNHVVPTRAQRSGLAPWFECKDVSVQVPVRKKMKAELATDREDVQTSCLNLLNPTTSEIEHSLLVSEVDQVFCLPMPDKQARQMNFVVFPKTGGVDALGRPAEQIVFVMNETDPTGVVAQGVSVNEEDTSITVSRRALDRWLSPVGRRVVTPSDTQFASSIPQSHRKGEKAYHVKAHRGSKEGYLFFLENGIVFGFKKPLAFFPFAAIESISYTSVLQRTFNLVIAAMDGEGEAAQVKEVEFGMLDQADFAGIDEYVKKHGLNDASMAAQRRAKAYNVNKEKWPETNNESGSIAGAEDAQTELQKAEQQLQDEEDELEEDYEVSGGESEGEGEDSEEEEAYEDEEVEEVEADQDGFEDDE